MLLVYLFGVPVTIISLNDDQLVNPLILTEVDVLATTTPNSPRPSDTLS